MSDTLYEIAVKNLRILRQIEEHLMCLEKKVGNLEKDMKKHIIYNDEP